MENYYGLKIRWFQILLTESAAALCAAIVYTPWNTLNLHTSYFSALLQVPLHCLYIIKDPADIEVGRIGC